MLLVEDEPALRAQLRAGLQDAGYAVDEADNGRDAHHLGATESYDAVVLGGAKVDDKLAVIDNLMGTADRPLLGGGMLFTFLGEQGDEIGRRLIDEGSLED